MVIPAVITVYADRSFSFVLKSPPAAVLIKKACKIESGSKVPNKDKVAKITKDQLKEIAEIKKNDLNAASIEAAMSMIAGTCRSMGVHSRRLKEQWEAKSRIPPGGLSNEERKNYLDSVKLYDKTTQYDVEQAVELCLQTAKAKFDETIELSVRLGVDPRHADQQVRGAVVLPHGTGKNVRVVVFAKGDKAKEAEEAGADYVGAEELVQKIQTENWFDF